MEKGALRVKKTRSYADNLRVSPKRVPHQLRRRHPNIFSQEGSFLSLYHPIISFGGRFFFSSSIRLYVVAPRFTHAHLSL